MLQAAHQLSALVRTIGKVAARTMTVAGPTCHATGSAEKTFVRLAHAADALIAGDPVGMAVALFWAAANLALAVEAVLAACHQLRKA